LPYKQLTYEQRVELKAYLKVGRRYSEIAALLGVHRSTVWREVHRNRGLRGYRARQAHERALDRRVQARKRKRFTEPLKQQVRQLLLKKWSPEQISGWLKNNQRPWVSHETIYQFVYEDKEQGGQLYTHLRRQRKKRRKRCKTSDRRGQIPNRVSIDFRDAVVDRKERVGDWEVDLIIGKGHQGALLTAVERRTKFLCMRALPSKKAERVAEALIEMLRPFSELVFTITADNGKEFAQHEKIAEALNARFYFAHPYCSWERGLNENTNGLIRQYFPKNKTLNHLCLKHVQRVQNKLNQRPRKTINFQTPKELLKKSLVALGT